MRSTTTTALLVVGAVVALLAGGALARHGWMDGHALPFYGGVILFTAGGVLLALATPRRARASAFVTTGTLVFWALLLPVADRVYAAAYRPGLGHIAPAYSYRDAAGDPHAFQAWWYQYLLRWHTAKDAIMQKDPSGERPFLLIPGGSMKFFDTTWSINSLGLHDREVDPHKGDRFRIIAMGESTTMGVLLRPEDEPWPRKLERRLREELDCAKTIEVLNAGVAGYDIEDGIAHLRRTVLPLEPDWIISYHGWNGLRYLGTSRRYFPRERLRPSAILAALELRLERWRYWDENASLEPTSDEYEEVLTSRYAEFYEEFLDLADSGGARVALLSFNLAIDASTPREVVAFYAAGFPDAAQTVVGIELHNHMIREIAARRGALFADVSHDLAGRYDDDLFIDLGHFTDRGRERLAANVFAALEPELREDPDLRCQRRERRAGGRPR